MISRRTFCNAAAGALVLNQASLHADSRAAVARYATEWSYTSGKEYKDPFSEVELDVIFEGPNGLRHRVPAFWAGGQNWRVRYAPPVSGQYSFQTVCTDTTNRNLHGQTGEMDVRPYEGQNHLYQHGPLQISDDHRHFQHADHTPFFWLGDTWWMGLTKRLRWPDDFQTLTADRVLKGFTVVQIVAGLFPDMPAFDPRGENEAGFPWQPSYASINPAWFDMADVRIQHLVDQGIVPCIVGCWGYFLRMMGVPKVKQHWRNLIARWGCYPVVWCLAGEGTMPYYLSTNKDEDIEFQRKGWTELARYVRSTDPYHHPITIHPGNQKNPSHAGRGNVEDAGVLDFDMLQIGPAGWQITAGFTNEVKSIAISRNGTPKMPVLVGEMAYEGQHESNRQEAQRVMFWLDVLNGSAGHTYGASGIWQVNTREHPFGRSPTGRNWDSIAWDIAYRYPGSRQLGMSKALLQRYEWWRFEPHPEWVDPHWDGENVLLPHAAGIPGEVRFIYLPNAWNQGKVKMLEPNRSYRAFFFNPADGKEVSIGAVHGDANGEWEPPILPQQSDWLIILDRKV